MLQQMNSEDEAKKGKEDKKGTEDPAAEKEEQGLDAYMLRHTSEDNVSFEEVVEEGEKKRRIKW